MENSLWSGQIGLSGKQDGMRFSAILVAAGSGLRAGGEVPKQWQPLGGKAVARWSMEALLAAGCEHVVVAVAEDGMAFADSAFHGLSRWTAVVGGRERGQSVVNALEALESSTDLILVHDAARPFLKVAHIQALLEALVTADAVAPALPVADTLKRAHLGTVIDTPAREGLYRVQTPQAFRADVLRSAYRQSTSTATDDTALVEAMGGNVVLIPGDPMLMKLTYPEDFLMAEKLVGPARISRTGQGFDAHRWGPGDAVWLCGLRLDHDQALVGHSDADAGLHALTDALLGAMGLGDIGDHFPPTDPQWKGVASEVFLKHAAKLVRAQGAEIINVDVTLICERPKIKPHRQAMQHRVADILAIAPDRVSIKATTTEGMGFTGRGEGLAAQALATLLASS